MKKIIIGLIAIGLLGWYFYTPSFGAANTPEVYRTASSTAMTIGDDISTNVLQANGKRGYAKICNLGVNKAYLKYSSTAILATTTASVYLPAGSCHEIDSEGLYKGDVLAIQETSTTTASLTVLELSGQ